MRTTTRLVVSAAVLGSGLLLAAPASAQVACPYPHDCLPLGGGEEVPATGGGKDVPTIGGGEEAPATGGGGFTPDTTANGSAGPASLPFTGGEVALIALTGVAALGGGAVLVAAGRKRETT